MSKTALILGATGLVGNFCLDILLGNPNYSNITIIVRKTISLNHNKLNEIICPDFSKLYDYEAAFNVDEVFCCIGTTIKTAGSKEAFSAVDFVIPVSAARLSAKQKVSLFSVISAIGANEKSTNFYLQTKGLMEQQVKLAGIEKVHIFRPGLIMGERKEHRNGEKIAQLLMPLIDKLFFGKFKKYSSISASDIAQSMVNAAIDEDSGEKIYTFLEMKKELN